MNPVCSSSKKKDKTMAAKKDRVLWADDEIDLLKPHILFLQDKGYEVIPVISGQDAIECCKEESFDIISQCVRSRYG